MKRFLALILAALLLPAAAMANRLEGVFDPYLDGNADVRFTASAQLSSLTPYGEETIALLNGALRSLSVEASVTADETSVAIRTPSGPVMQLTERTTAQGTELTADVLPNRTLVSARSALDALTGPQEEEAFDLFLAIEETEACYRALTDAIKPYAEEKKANYKIKNVATSRWSRVARLTVEQSTELAPLIAQVLGCGMDAAFREQLSALSCSKGFIVALYQLKEGGDDIAVYMKGNITLADGKSRSLAYQWAFHTEDGVRVDTYKFEMGKSSAARDSRTISASVERSAQSDVFLLEGETSAAIRDTEGDTVTTSWEYDLSGRAEGDVRPISGEVSLQVKTTVDGETETCTTAFAPDVKLMSSEGSGVLSGRVDMTYKIGKTVHAELALLFDETAAAQFAQAAQSGGLYVVIDGEPAPPSSLTQNRSDPDDFLVGKPPIGLNDHAAANHPVTVNLDTLSEADRAALTDEMAQRLAGNLLPALVGTEGEGLIRDNMTEEDYDAFLALVEGL